MAALPAHEPVLSHRFDGPEDAPVLVLAPSIGTTVDLWEPQLPALTRSWRVLRYDLPGHGGSAPMRGTVEDFAVAVLTLLDELGLDQIAYGGVSLGGAIGTVLAAGVPDRVVSLVLCCTSACFGDTDGWRDRAAAVRALGLEPLAGLLTGRWFTPGYAGAEDVLAMLGCVDPEGYAACCEALAGFDARDRLGGVRAPTLVIAGADDIATPFEHAEALVAGIRGSSLAVVPGAHLANLEAPGPVTDAMVRHLGRTRAGERWTTPN